MVDITGGYMKLKYISALSLIAVTLCIGFVAISNNKDVEEAMDFASKVGALSVMKEGAQSSLPTLEDVENFRG